MEPVVVSLELSQQIKVVADMISPAPTTTEEIREVTSELTRELRRRAGLVKKPKVYKVDFGHSLWRTEDTRTLYFLSRSGFVLQPRHLAKAPKCIREGLRRVYPSNAGALALEQGFDRDGPVRSKDLPDGLKTNHAGKGFVELLTHYGLALAHQHTYDGCAATEFHGKTSANAYRIYVGQTRGRLGDTWLPCKTVVKYLMVELVAYLEKGN